MEPDLTLGVGVGFPMEEDDPTSNLPGRRLIEGCGGRRESGDEDAGGDAQAGMEGSSPFSFWGQSQVV